MIKMKKVSYQMRKKDLETENEVRKKFGVFEKCFRR